MRLLTPGAACGVQCPASGDVGMMRVRSNHMTVRGTCRLCAMDGDLQESHIIPKFVVAHQKETSATGYIRSSESINRREQDGPKQYMLCKTCEQKLNMWETPFAAEVYHPWCSGKAVQLPYGPWMLKFAASVSWRTLTWYMDSPAGMVDLTGDAKSLLLDALRTWKRFMFDEIPNPRQYEQHMLLFDRIERATHLRELPPNFNRFLTRGTHVNLAHSRGHPLFIFTKMGKVTLLGFLGIKHPRQWVGTKLHVKQGEIGGDITVPSQFSDYLAERARRAQEKYDALSDRQKDVVGKSFERDLDRVAASESFQMMAADVEMFGRERVFPRKDGGEPGR